MVKKVWEITEEEDTLLQKILVARGLVEKDAIQQHFAYSFKRMIASENESLVRGN